MKSNLVYLSLSALLLVFTFQNCNATHFKTDVDVEEAASTQAEEIPQEQAPQVSTPAPAPLVFQTAPAPAPTPAVYSTCQTETFVKPCPSNTPNCTCTDTLRAGTYDITQLIRGRHTDDEPQPGGYYDLGPSCVASGSGSHSGTVTGLSYGVCNHYCTIMAKCVNGQWTDFYVTW